jgi:hypothetical protein
LTEQYYDDDYYGGSGYSSGEYNDYYGGSGYSSGEYNECTETSWTCPNDGKCIPGEWLCDDWIDCDEGEDESTAMCGEKCGADEYQCSVPGEFGACIPETWLCDAYLDCGDAEDESDAMCSEDSGEGESEVDYDNEGCGEGYWTCASNGQCIYDSWLCDGGAPDCTNGEDESAEYCNVDDGSGSKFTTSSTTSSAEPSCDDTNDFTCPSTGECIPIAWRCDAIVDCTEGDDESEEVCGSCDTDLGQACKSACEECYTKSDQESTDDDWMRQRRDGHENPDGSGYDSCQVCSDSCEDYMHCVDYKGNYGYDFYEYDDGSGWLDDGFAVGTTEDPGTTPIPEPVRTDEPALPNESTTLVVDTTKYFEPPVYEKGRSDTCTYQTDDVCDEPDYCAVGTDCSDCGNCHTANIPTTTSPAPTTTDEQKKTLNSNGKGDTCEYANDNYCKCDPLFQ